jgi:hypothetical protein
MDFKKLSQTDLSDVLARHLKALEELDDLGESIGDWQAIKKQLIRDCNETVN